MKQVIYFTIVIISVIFVLIKCSDSENKGGLVNNCGDFRDQNVQKCIDGLSKGSFKGDTEIARKYCECTIDEILKKYSCDEIKEFKKLSQEEQRKIYLPITAECSKKFLKK